MWLTRSEIFQESQGEWQVDSWRVLAAGLSFRALKALSIIGRTEALVVAPM